MERTPAGLLTEMFAAIAAAIHAEAERLCDLDGLIGDADHGTTMDLGFKAVNAALAHAHAHGHGDRTPADIFLCAANAFLDAVGASTGPLYATGFRCAARRLGSFGDFGPERQVAALEGIAEGIATRGKAQRGDKTMLDVWLPAAEAAREALSGAPADLWPRALRAAAEGAEATRSMVASRGRAARLGNRSLGHLDPGAVSATVILAAMGEVLAPGSDLTRFTSRS